MARAVKLVLPKCDDTFHQQSTTLLAEGVSSWCNG